MSATIALTAEDARRVFQALMSESRRLDDVADEAEPARGHSRARAYIDQLREDAEDARRLARAFSGLCAQGRAVENYPCDSCRRSRRDRATCGHPRHANICMGCDASLQHAGADR